MIPTTTDDAIDLYKKTYRKKFPDDIHLQEHLKIMEDELRKFAKVEELSEEVLLRVQNAVNKNHLNPAFKAFEDVHGQQNVIACKQLKYVTKTTRAEFRGDVSFVYQYEHFKKASAPYVINPKTLKPIMVEGKGTVSSYGGIEATLRHEYAHGLVEGLNKKQITRLQTLYEKPPAHQAWWGDHATQYSATNYREAACELFSMATDPLYKTAGLDSYVKSTATKLLEMIGQ